jgi:hypothetical protein
LKLQRFWELEDLPNKPQAPEAIRCENHFIHNTTRDSDGCYITLLPRRLEHGPLGESYSQAKQCLLQLESRLQGQPEIRDAYNNFMTEYEMLGHMKEVQGMILITIKKCSIYDTMPSSRRPAPPQNTSRL